MSLRCISDNEIIGAHPKPELIRKCLKVPPRIVGILAPAFQEGDTFTFTMCNPPFFASMEEAGQNSATAFSGTAAEMVCPGGEMSFVTRMVSDSLALQVLNSSSALSSGL